MTQGGGNGVSSNQRENEKIESFFKIFKESVKVGPGRVRRGKPSWKMIS